MSPSTLERELDFWLEAYDLPAPVPEHRFHPTRRWRFDRAWPDRMLAVEVEGGTWMRGRHVRGAGFRQDCEKYNAAALLGWRVLRFTAGMIRDGTAIDTLKEALDRKGDR